MNWIVCFLLLSLSLPTAFAQNNSQIESQPYSVSPELVEERNFGESAEKTFALSAKPYGKKILTLFIASKEHPQLRLYGTAQPFDNVTLKEAEMLLGKKIGSSSLICSEFFGWNGMKTEHFKIVAKFKKKQLICYQVLKLAHSKKGGE